MKHENHTNITQDDISASDSKQRSKHPHENKNRYKFEQKSELKSHFAFSSIT